MKQAAFRTNPVSLEELLRHCASGKIQLPDFQRSWVWDEERIKGLVASISQAFPVGALMTLEMKSGTAETFARRPVQGALPSATDQVPDQLLLDGQQRMTSLYQTCMRREVVQTVTPRLKLVDRWFYIDIRAALNGDTDRQDAIISIPKDRKVKSAFGKEVDLDLSSVELEYQNLMFPLNQVFDWDEWQDGFNEHWNTKEHRDLFRTFKNEILQNFKGYQVPVIALSPDTSHEAVCLVFEKVNTGGKPLDAFELVTAMYAAKGHRLRDDWLGADGQPGLQHRLQVYGRAAEQKFGPIDVLVNNAGWDVFRPFTKTEPVQWDKLIAINLTGALHMHHAVLPGMVARRSGRIVNIASDAARVGSSGEAVYAACKGGLVAFSKTIAREHARHGITVNVVCPGPTDTALFADYKEGAGNPEKLEEAFKRSIPLGRIGQPDDLPGAILFFASADAAYVTGQVLSVSGGLTMNG